MFEEKSPLLGVVLTVLAIIAGVSTIFSCVIAFIALARPEQALVIIERWAAVPTPTPILIIATAPPGEALATYTPYPTHTPYPPQPTHTSYPTHAVPATPTLTPSPVPVVLPLPFEDDFDLGPRQEWETLQGTWRMVDGSYTADARDTWSTTVVGDATWRDYVVDVDVEYWSDFEPIRVLVRCQGDSHMAFEFDGRGGDWILVEGGGSRAIAHTEQDVLRAGSGWHQVHMRIEVDGSTFTAIADGATVLRVQDTTLASGKAGLAFESDYQNTPRFDNFTVTPLP